MKHIKFNPYYGEHLFVCQTDLRKNQAPLDSSFIRNINQAFFGPIISLIPVRLNLGLLKNSLDYFSV
jgi:hypothetical protein